MCCRHTLRHKKTGTLIFVIPPVTEIVCLGGNFPPGKAQDWGLIFRGGLECPRDQAPLNETPSPAAFLPRTPSRDARRAASDRALNQRAGGDEVLCHALGTGRGHYQRKQSERSSVHNGPPGLHRWIVCSEVVTTLIDTRAARFPSLQPRYKRCTPRQPRESFYLGFLPD